jgi:thioredoxin 2
VSLRREDPSVRVESATDVSLIRCPACGATNRVPHEPLARGRVPDCGKCKRPLPVEEVAITVTDETYAEAVERSPLPVLLDAWAGWCMPCRVVAPIVEQLAAEMRGRIRVVKLNVDENPRTAGRLNIAGLPTLLVLKRGREADRIVGVRPKAEISQRLERVLA